MQKLAISSVTLLGLLLTTGPLSWSQSASSAAGGQEQLSPLRSVLRFQRDLLAAKTSAKKTLVSKSDPTDPTVSKAALSAKVYNFISVDYPGDDTSIVTDWNGKTGVAQGSEAFTYVTNDYEIYTVPDASDTVPFGINSSGVIVGGYDDLLTAKTHAFVDNAGSVTTLDFPGATVTLGADINDAGDSVGVWDDAAGNEHGYSYIGGAFAAIDFPLATRTEAIGINALGVIVGDWTDAASKTHGYIFSKGQFTPLDFPGASSTIAFGVNDAGAVAGYYTDASGVQHGFLYQKTFSTIDVAGAKSTMILRINNKNQIAGTYVDASSESHGLIGR
jgi:probable HAF family extracellular repeat protein